MLLFFQFIHHSEGENGAHLAEVLPWIQVLVSYHPAQIVLPVRQPLLCHTPPVDQDQTLPAGYKPGQDPKDHTGVSLKADNQLPASQVHQTIQGLVLPFQVTHLFRILGNKTFHQTRKAHRLKQMEQNQVYQWVKYVAQNKDHLLQRKFQ